MTGIGARLIEAREARGLTLEDAERDTRISRRYLQALEDEEFDVIPAPVYARGFLRSYSQYIGLDPQEMLALFPRDDDPAQRVPDQRPTAIPPTPPGDAGARPAWRRPQAEPDVGQQVVGGEPYPSQPRMPERTPTPFGRPAARSGPRQTSPAEPASQTIPGPSYEPTIGIDIGVPRREGLSPARRISNDPGAQTRTMAVTIAAIVGILGVIFLALVISRMGGSDGSEGGFGPPAGVSSTQNEASTGTNGQPAPAGQASGLDVTPGIVPNVIGEPEQIARLAIVEAGFNDRVVYEQTADHEPGVVIDQAPAPGTEQATDVPVTISVSEGP